MNINEIIEVTERMSEARKAAKKMKQKESPRGGSVLTQYAKMGKIFIPTTDTQKTLPTGCYKIVPLQNGALGFESQKLYTDAILRLPDSKSEEVINEIEKFWTLKDKYKKYGLSFKRGFMLHGPPGSGKTCTVTMIVDQMVKLGGVVIFGDNPGWVGNLLAGMREVEPKRPLVVVLEDIDSIIARFGEAQLLSLLDGEMQVDNVVFIATTNYPETLDQRIINRPSRFDMVVRIDVPNPAARKMYLESRLEGKHTVTDTDGEHDLVALSEGFSIAHLRELIVASQVFGHKVADTVERLKKMKFVPKSGSQRRIGIEVEPGYENQAEPSETEFE